MGEEFSLIDRRDGGPNGLDLQLLRLMARFPFRQCSVRQPTDGACIGVTFMLASLIIELPSERRKGRVPPAVDAIDLWPIELIWHTDGLRLVCRAGAPGFGGSRFPAHGTRFRIDGTYYHRRVS
jgi:hypothetical protein